MSDIHNSSLMEVPKRDINVYITQAYSGMRSRSKRRGDPYPLFNKTELRNWLFENGLLDKWTTYENSGYDFYKKPSIDRIDEYGIYEFDNMQLITWRENHLKGCHSEKLRISTTISNKKNHCKKVYQFDKDYNLIAEYSSLQDASNETGVHVNDISRNCTGKRNISHGFYFSHLLLTKENHKLKQHKLCKKIIQMDLNGEVIRKWESNDQASKALNINPSNLSGACNGRLGVVGGFRWRYDWVKIEQQETALINKELTIKEGI